MTDKDFQEIVTTRTGRIRAVLSKKGEEYVENQDRIGNFKSAAKLLHTTPEKALLGFVTKQIVSLFNLILTDRTAEYEKIDERITDIINYMILLDAIIIEKTDL